MGKDSLLNFMCPPPSKSEEFLERVRTTYWRRKFERGNKLIAKMHRGQNPNLEVSAIILRHQPFFRYGKRVICDGNSLMRLLIELRGLLITSILNFNEPGPRTMKTKGPKTASNGRSEKIALATMLLVDRMSNFYDPNVVLQAFFVKMNCFIKNDDGVFCDQQKLDIFFRVLRTAGAICSNVTGESS